MNHLKYLAALAAVTALGGGARAQVGWSGECYDPDDMMPESTDYGIQQIGNLLFSVSLGVSGTATFGGGTPHFCYNAKQMDASGRFAFMSGPTGSVQSNFDDLLALTTGAPRNPIGDLCFAKILKDDNTGGNSEVYGDGGLSVAFVGASNRYIQSGWSDGDVQVVLIMRSIGDAVRFQWTLTNLLDEPQPLGLAFAAWTGMRTSNGIVDSQANNANQAHSTLGTISGNVKFTPDRRTGFVYLPTTLPARNERRYDINNPKFPDYVDFMFGQTEAYGLRIQNTANEATKDASQVDLLMIGNHAGPVEALILDNNLRFHVAGDATGIAEEADLLLANTSFIQRIPVESVAPGQSREIVQYFRSTWSTASYLDPYSLILDAPRTLSSVASGTDGLTPNPMTVRVYLDNQYAQLDREIALSDVRFTINLPTGMSLMPNEAQVKTVNAVAPNALAFVEWRVQADGTVFGTLPISVTCEPTPGPAKTITTDVMVASTPRLRVPAGANMVGLPYQFSDTSLNVILGLQNTLDYVAFRWDPETLSYTPVATPVRGEGYWLVAANDEGLIDLAGASNPQDAGSGGLITTLKSGWNMISNPYSYPLQLSDLLAVAEDDPEVPLTWVELINNGFVNSALAYWDSSTNSYKYTSAITDKLMPHQGYWIYVNTFKALRISWPPVYQPGMANSGRSVQNDPAAWTQTDKNWRLQLSARSANAVDASNYVGVASDRKKAEQNSLVKPPMPPQGGEVELAIVDTVKGQPTRMAQSLIDRAGRKEWTVSVRSEKAGDVTVTWPNIGTLPKNVRFRLVDEAAGVSKDLRAASGYTFTASEASTRELKLTMEVGGSTRPVIGDVLVTPTGKAGSSPVNITYALSADAMVTVRILSGTGKEVFTLSRGRSESAGSNSVTWMLRDSANRAVAPGTYRVEILAETPSGERVRRIVPINVIR